MKNIILLIILTFTLNAKLVDGVAIVVKGRAITLLDIKKEMKLLGLPAKKAADVLIRKKLEEIEIKERKISVANGEVYDDIKPTWVDKRIFMEVIILLYICIIRLRNSTISYGRVEFLR